MLKIENLSVIIDDKPIITNFNLNLKPQEIKYLTGKNGSGKTTILNAVCGFIPITNGKIEILEGKRVALFAHKNPIFHNISVKQNIKLWLNYNNEKNFDDIFAIEKFANLKAGQLSKGWQAKLSLTIFFINRAEIKLMDEPFSNLDEEGSEILKNYILGTSKAGAGFLISSHGNPEKDFKATKHNIFTIKKSIL
jgi:ABC-type multidrug transport system ATPase subunit